jgi:ribosome-associated heat shock protein Hsp15
MTASSSPKQRLDKWLFFSRMARSRTLAQTWIESGHVTVNGEKIRRPSADIKIGDRLEVLAGRRLLILVVKAAAERRGPYEEARHLYDDISPPPEKLTRFEQALREPGSGRPEKKERRQIDRLRNLHCGGDD